MNCYRERSEDGSELIFDHGAPCFSVNANNLEVQNLVNDWESRGLVAEWKENFGSFDFVSRKFVSTEEVSTNSVYERRTIYQYISFDYFYCLFH